MGSFPFSLRHTNVADTDRDVKETDDNTHHLSFYENIDMNKELISHFPLRKSLHYNAETKQTIIDYLSRNHFNGIVGLSQLTLEYLDICNVFSLSQTSAQFTLEVYYGDLRWCNSFQIVASPYKPKNTDIPNTVGGDNHKNEQEKDQDHDQQFDIRHCLQQNDTIDDRKDTQRNIVDSTSLNDSYNASQMQLQTIPKTNNSNNNCDTIEEKKINGNIDHDMIKCGTTYFGSVKFTSGSGNFLNWTSYDFTFADNCQFKIYKDNKCEIFRIEGYLGSKMRCSKSYYNQDKKFLEESIKKVQYCLQNKIFYIPFKQIEQFWMLDDNHDRYHDVNTNTDYYRENHRYTVYRNEYHGPWCLWYCNQLDFCANAQVNIKLVTKNSTI